MGWVVAGTWIGAGVLAVVLLGFCGYELSWKARRLHGDLDRLAGLADALTALRVEIEAIRDRAEASQRLASARDVR